MNPVCLVFSVNKVKISDKKQHRRARPISARDMTSSMQRADWLARFLAQSFLWCDGKRFFFGFYKFLIVVFNIEDISNVFSLDQVPVSIFSSSIQFLFFQTSSSSSWFSILKNIENDISIFNFFLQIFQYFKYLL